MQKALVVLSGGQDSTTCLAWACRNFDDVAAVTFNYNQRHSRELIAAARVAKLYHVKHEQIDVGPLLRGRSPLTNPAESLETYADHGQMESVIGDRVELTFVPMRNAFFLTLAANIAVTKDITNLIAGVCEADNANYPDCRTSFIRSQEATINEALGTRDFQIHAPLLSLDKSSSVELMMKFGLREFATLAYTHTAYDGGYPPVSKDHASILRAYGFAQRGVPDPLVIRAVMEGAQRWPYADEYSHLHAFINDLTTEIRKLGKELGGVTG